MNKLFKQLLMALSCLVFVVGMPACSKCCKGAKTECSTKKYCKKEGSCHKNKEVEEEEIMEEDMDMDDSY